jgi:hypothetical protein
MEILLMQIAVKFDYEYKIIMEAQELQLRLLAGFTKNGKNLNMICIKDLVSKDTCYRITALKVIRLSLINNNNGFP